MLIDCFPVTRKRLQTPKLQQTNCASARPCSSRFHFQLKLTHTVIVLKLQQSIVFLFTLFGFLGLIVCAHLTLLPRRHFGLFSADIWREAWSLSIRTNLSPRCIGSEICASSARSTPILISLHRTNPHTYTLDDPNVTICVITLGSTCFTKAFTIWKA